MVGTGAKRYGDSMHMTIAIQAGMLFRSGTHPNSEQRRSGNDMVTHVVCHDAKTPGNITDERHDRVRNQITDPWVCYRRNRKRRVP